jgi:hypothetical protein
VLVPCQREQKKGWPEHSEKPWARSFVWVSLELLPAGKPGERAMLVGGHPFAIPLPRTGLVAVTVGTSVRMFSAALTTFFAPQ